MDKVEVVDREPKVLVVNGNALTAKSARFFASEYEMFLFFDDEQLNSFLLSIDDSEMPKLLVASAVGCNIDDALRVVKLIYRHERFRSIPFVVVSDSWKSLARRKCFEIGAKDCIASKTPNEELRTRIGRVLTDGAEISCLSTKVERQAKDLSNATLQIVDALLSTIEENDSYTEGHSTRVRDVAMMLARRVRYPREKMPHLENAALLHDIGKIGIANFMLHKPRKLSKKEFEQIKLHPGAGWRILSKIDGFSMEMDVALHHHERWDGGGYPEGISGKDISLEARIVAIADAYDVMKFGRDYQHPKTDEEIAREIEENAGTQFDPHLAKVFAKLVREGRIGGRKERVAYSSIG